MKAIQRGFTLIELVVVIVILGILAATALPKFVDMTGEAGDASAKAVVGALSSATAVNYAAKVAGTAGAVTLAAANTCADLIPLLVGGALPADVTFVDGTQVLTGCDTAGDVNALCKVAHAKGATAAGFAVTTVCTGA